jgi:hypothetical protein
VELLEMHKDGIMVAEYWTGLLPKKIRTKNTKPFSRSKGKNSKKKFREIIFSQSEGHFLID